ncbi:MAG: sugar-binding domain-containing protein [Planctomycetota bacterium]
MSTSDRGFIRRHALALFSLWAAVLPMSAETVSAEIIEGNPDFARQAEQDSTAVDTEVLSQEPGFVGVLPEVRLTPRDVEVPGMPDSRLSLDGEWSFVFEVPEGFDGTAASVPEWNTVQMPGHFALQGFPRMHKEFGIPVAYTKTFEVPASWADQRVVLRFEGVDGYTKLWVNGRKVGENDIATLPSEYDLTDYVEVGGVNELTLTIEKSLVTYWSRRELGGLTRTTYLQALPTVNLARLHVDTELNHDNTAATLNARVRVANQGDAARAGLKMRFSLEDQAGNPHPLRKSEATVPLPAIAPGQTLSFKVPLHVAGFRTWTAETPNLYRLVGEIVEGGKDAPPIMSARQRFGFREVAVVGHEIRLNGRPLKLRGTNYHITYPGLNESVPRDLLRQDLELFRGANLNVLRSRPTPMIDYVELCDELGMYTTVEAMITLMMYDKGPFKGHGENPEIAGPYRHHLATMIESYYSNPSVITWGLGNECPYYDYFKTAAIGAHAADPSRPLFFGSDARLGVGIAYMDINDDHYPRKGYKDGEAPFHVTGYTDDPTRIDGTGWEYPDDRPNIFTEWLHMHTNNGKEIAFDPGVDDYWGYAAATHAEQLYLIPQFAGGFHFKGAPYRGIVASPQWRGLFSENRRPNDTYWHVQKSHSPVRIAETAGALDPTGSQAVYQVENRNDFSNLSDMTFAWSQGPHSGEAEVDVTAKQAGTFALPFDPSVDAPIELVIKTAYGRVVDRYHLTVASEDAAPAAESAAATGKLEVAESDGKVQVDLGEQRFVFDQATGKLLGAAVGGQPVLTGSPELMILPTQLKNFRQQKELTLVNQAKGWETTDVKAQKRDDKVAMRSRGRYGNAEGEFVTTIHADGRVEIAYDFEWTSDLEFNVFSAGLRLPIDPALDRLVWKRDPQWSAYPDLHIGRPEGIAPATGEPSYADMRAGYTEGRKPWPWSQDLISGVTRDFRSTKFNLIRGGLFNEQGVGIEVDGTADDDKKTHLQAVPSGDNLDGKLAIEAGADGALLGYDLQVMNFHNGGTEPHLTKSIRFEEIHVAKGQKFAGTVSFRLETGE